MSERLRQQGWTSTGPFADFQDEVYLKDLFGELPTLPFGLREVGSVAYAVTTSGAGAVGVSVGCR